tara:strand:+ start:6339 stop:10571 length:4233 start_codon:yes stop_codon:yes gene_type:complete
MSTTKNKKALLEKLKRQKEKDKKNVFTIPKVKPSSQEKKRKIKKTFIPTKSTVLEKSKTEDNMRDFLASVISLTDQDFDFNPEDDVINFTNPSIQKGYKEFKNDRLLSALEIDDSIDKQLVNEESKKLWSELPKGHKMIWVIVGYGREPRAEWGRKKFTNEILLRIKTEENLEKLIEAYIKSNVTYDRFLDKWFESGGKETLEILDKELIEKGESTSVKNRAPITEQEQSKINDLNETLNSFKEVEQELIYKKEVRNEHLSSLQRNELVEIVKPIIGIKTNEQLINFLVDVRFRPIERKMRKEMYNDVWASYKSSNSSDNSDTQKKYIDTANLDKDWELYMKDIQGQRANYELELKKLSRGDLVLEAINKKDTPSLIKLILESEFKSDLDNIKEKIFLLTIEIHNLSLGTYIPRHRQERSLKSIEKKLAARYLLISRENELNRMTINELNDFADQIPGIDHSDDKNTIISEIIKIEFPDDDRNNPLPIATKNEINNALRYLPEERLRLFADGTITKIDKRGRYEIIEKLLHILFPEIKKSTKKLVSSFNIIERKKELDLMSSQKIAQIAFQLDIYIPYSSTDRQIINKILEKEKKTNKLITEEDNAKIKLIKKVSSITGRSKNFYESWNIDALKQRLYVLQDEDEDYARELEQERLFTKLKQIGDISKYPNADTWSVEKLRETLESIGGPDWENYKPLIEDHNYLNCVQKYNFYPWIEGRVTGVWLTAPTKGNQPSSEYIFKSRSIIENKVKWYMANKRFFSLQCNSYKSKRTQTGDILSCYTQTGKLLQFKVGFTISGYKYSPDQYQARTRMVKNSSGQLVERSFIIQDEEMFQKELLYNRKQQQNTTQKIIYIENSPVDEKSINIATKTLSEALMTTLDNPLSRTDYGIIKPGEHFKQLNKSYLYVDLTIPNDEWVYKRIDFNTPYMQILMDTILTSVDQTNKDLFTKVAEIVVYLKIPQAKMFKNNISKEYYLPDILPYLSAEEKFPEVFEDIMLPPSFIEGVVATINNAINREVRNMAEKRYFLEDTTKRKTTKITDYSSIEKIKTNKRISLCQNKEKLKNTDPSQIVYYLDDDGKIYCFTIDELHEQFTNDNIINPESNNNFNLKFVNRFKELYNNRLSSEGFLDSHFQDKYGFNIEKQVSDKRNIDTIKKSRPEVCPNLWNMISDDIEELEDQLSNEKPEDGDIIDEEREPERREQEYEDGERESPNIDPDDACIYCKENLADDGIKSIIMHGDESRIIKFCSFKCFEDKNDWKKYKAKKQKKRIKQTKKIQKQIDDAKEKVKQKMDQENKPPSPPKLTKEEIKQRKKKIKQQVKQGLADFDRIAFPLLTKTELREIANEKGIKINGSLGKMGTAKALFEALHPKAQKGIYKEEKAEREMNKKDSKKRKKTDKTDKKKKKKKAK